MSEKNFLNELTDEIYKALGHLMVEDLNIIELRLAISKVVKEVDIRNEPLTIKALRLQIEAKNNVISGLQKQICDIRANMPR